MKPLHTQYIILHILIIKGQSLQKLSGLKTVESEFWVGLVKSENWFSWMGLLKF